MDWFKIYGGDWLSDPKFRWLAMRTGLPKVVVQGFFAQLLARASVARNPGSFAEVAAEDEAAELGLEASQVRALLDAFEEKGMTAAGRIANWEKRQAPKFAGSPGAELLSKRERARQLKAEGHSLNEISREVGTSRSTAKRWAEAPARDDAASPGPLQQSIEPVPAVPSAPAVPSVLCHGVPWHSVAHRDREEETEDSKTHDSVSARAGARASGESGLCDGAEAEGKAQAAALKAMRREKWLTRTLMDEARLTLTPEKWVALMEACQDDPTPRWAQKELDRISKLNAGGRRSRGKARGAPLPPGVVPVAAPDQRFARAPPAPMGEEIDAA